MRPDENAGCTRKASQLLPNRPTQIDGRVAAKRQNKESPLTRRLTKSDTTMQRSELGKPKQPKVGIFTLRPHVDWISLGIAVLLGLLVRFINVHIPW